MTEIDAANIKLSSAFSACKRHVELLLYAKTQLSENAPFTAEFLGNARPDQIASMDQFVFRFGRLQDTMGAQVFPAVLQLTGEYKPESTFIDRLNALEKFGAISFAKDKVFFYRGYITAISDQLTIKPAFTHITVQYRANKFAFFNIETKIMIEARLLIDHALYPHHFTIIKSNLTC